MLYWYIGFNTEYELIVSSSNTDAELLLTIFNEVFSPYSKDEADKKLAELTNAKESAEEKNA